MLKSFSTSVVASAASLRLKLVDQLQGLSFHQRRIKLDFRFLGHRLIELLGQDGEIIECTLLPLASDGNARRTRLEAAKIAARPLLE